MGLDMDGYSGVARVSPDGLRVGFFFALADWMHPAYPTPYAVDWPPA